MEYTVKKVFDDGRAGIFEVTATTMAALNEALDTIYKKYPINPYGTATGPITKAADGTFHQKVTHYGAD